MYIHLYGMQYQEKSHIGKIFYLGETPDEASLMCSGKLLRNFVKLQ